MLQALQRVHDNALVRVQRGKSPKTFGSFYITFLLFRGHINRRKFVS